MPNPTLAFRAPRRPALLVILDGFGLNPSRAHNAVALARTPRLDKYFAHHPHTVLQASGQAVGLPNGQMGNSEVGHLTLGSGCILRQSLVRIDDAITDGSFFDNSALTMAVDNARGTGRPLHLVGLVSDGGIHSHLNHLLALVELCHRRGCIPQVHAITDGRDTPPRSALTFLSPLEVALGRVGGHVGSICGRYYAMDRDQRWERLQLAWNALIHGVGEYAEDYQAAVEAAYAREEGDEFIRPTLLPHFQAIVPGDEVIFFNFRSDRVRQFTLALSGKEFFSFERGSDYCSVRVTCMTEYDSTFNLPVAFTTDVVKNLLSAEVSHAGLRQFHCAETEKYAHVTFFFNGGNEESFPGEERVMLPSPRVASYDQQPEMSAAQVADTVIGAIQSGEYPFIVVNFANGDMVGHTAIREAVIRAVEVLDREVGRVLDTAVSHGYSVVLTADHGNCEEMVDPITGQPHTQHTLYPVPCLVIDDVPWQLATGAGLSAVAPTILKLLGLPPAPGMEKRSLLLDPQIVTVKYPQ
ncbi:2,3-bisphosphoglycerate-independent phosphoglycerate mutase [Gammaproteobacteria bacterium]